MTAILVSFFVILLHFSNNYKEIYLRDSVAIPYKDKTFYLDSNGTYKVIVQSIIDESNVPVLWGDETKIVTEKQKIQEVFTINKDNKLSNYYYYEELQTNRDPYEPGNWYNTVKLVRREYKTINYSYNKRQEGYISYYNSL